LELKGREIKQKFYDALPSTFSYKKSLEVSDNIELKRKTAEKYLHDFRDGGILERVGHGKYKKVEDPNNL